MDGDDALRLGILGPLEVQRAGSTVVLTSATQRLILTRLAISGGPVSEDQLVDDVWGETPPASASTSLRAQISRLRTALRLGTSPPALVHGPGGYRFDGPVEIDAVRFEELVAGAGASDDPVAARDQLRRALELWRGDVLAEFRYEPFAQATIARLEALRLRALEDRIALDLDAGRADEVIPELEALSREHPLRERISELLVTALAHDDRVPEALATYRRVTTIHRDELGLPPSRRFQRLHDDLLRGRIDDVPAPPASAIDATGATDAASTTEAWRTVVGTVALPGVGDDVRLELLLVRAEGLRRAGRVEEARHTYAAAAQLATSLERPDELGVAVLGLVGPPEDSISGVSLDEALVERSLLRLPADHPVLPRLQARLAVALIDRGDHARGRSLLDTALAASRGAGDRSGIAYALRARHRSWFDPYALAERLGSADELLRIGRELDDLDVTAWGHRWRFIGLLEAGRLDEATTELDALEAIAAQLSDAFHRWFVVMRRAGLALVQRPADEAHAAVLEAVALTDRMPSPYTMMAAMLLFWSSHVLHGRRDEALRLAEQLAAAQPGPGAPVLAWSAAAAGDHGRARTILEELAADGFAAVLAQDHIRVLWLLNLTALAETACLLGDRDRAAVLRPLLAPFSGRSAVVGPGVTVVGTLDGALARLDALLA